MRFAGLLLISVTMMAAPASAAPVCRDIFRSRLHALDDATVSKLARDVERSSDRIRYQAAVGQANGRPFALDGRELETLLRNAARLLGSQGARVRAIRHQGFPALEILPEAGSKPGWNKMAASLLQKLNARLLFAPATLAKYGSRAHFQEHHDGRRSILISKESLARGRSDYLTGEEVGHAATNARALTDPHPFTGKIETFDPEVRPVIAKGTRSYRDQLIFDEAVRTAVNFVRLARDLERGSKTARRELLRVARNASDTAKILKVAVDDVQAVTRSLIIGAEGSGVAMAADGTPKARAAFVYTEGDRQVFVEQVSSKVVRLNFEGSGTDVEIYVRDPRGSLAELIAGLQTEDPSSLKRFQARLPAIINEWTLAQRTAITGLNASIRAVVSMRSVDDATLARDVRAAAKAIKPLVAKRRS